MQPKILSVDIETFPFDVSVWRLYDDNALQTLNLSVICGFSAKWYKGKQITRALPDYPNYTPGSRDDSQLVAELHELLSQADIVIAHNGRKFDIPVINGRFAVHNLPPPPPFKVVDTRLEAKRMFKLGSNSLDHLCFAFGLARKLATGGFELWQKCMAGDERAWARMKRYNAHDVKILEQLYTRMLPWMNHPNMTTYTMRPGCPNCGSTKMQSRGEARSETRVYHRYQCTKCGKWAKSVKSTYSAEIKAA